jgi:small membrane protein
MEFNIVQILIIVFALFAWSRGILRLRDKDISVGEFAFWSIIWAVVIFAAVFPHIIALISSKVGIGRGVDLAIYVSIILLFYLVFRLYVKTDNQDREITKLVREIAIRDAKKKKKK